MNAYLHGPSATPLLGETIGENLRRTVERVRRSRRARRPLAELPRDLPRAVGRDDRRWPARCSHRAYRQGDRVGIWSPNRYEWVVPQYATARIGAILVNINPAYKAAELEYALKQSGSRLSDPRQRVPHERLRRNAGRGARPTARSCGRRIVIDDDWRSLLETRGTPRRTRARGARDRSLQFDDPINIQYTSGTTGFPKGATLSHHNILNNGFFVGEALRYTEQDRVCIPVPFYHCFGMVLGNLGCTSHGACMVIPAEAFDPLATARGGRRRALHVAVRRADDVHRASSTIRASTSSI